MTVPPPEGMEFVAQYSAGDPNSLDIDVSEESAQDYRDGAALRRLREALPEGWHTVIIDGLPPRRDPTTQERTLWPCSVRVVDVGGHIVLERPAQTTAEAADKCREALT